MRANRKIYMKIVFFFTGFVGLSIYAASILNTSSSVAPTRDRGPASVLYDDEGEEVFRDVSLAELEAESKDDPDFKGSEPRKGIGGILSRDLNGYIGKEEATRKTGFRVSRGRLAEFDVRAFTNAVIRLEPGSKQRMIEMHLFSDAILKIRLERPSVHSTNDGVYWGTVEGDESSRVRLFVAGGKMNANIETSGHTYKVVDAGGSGSDHYVIEEDKSDSRR